MGKIKIILTGIFCIFLIIFFSVPIVYAHRNRLKFCPETVFMSRNLFVGADLFKVLEAQDPLEVPAVVAEVFQEIVDSAFVERDLL